MSSALLRPKLDQPLIRLSQQEKISWDSVRIGDLLAGKFLPPGNFQEYYRVSRLPGRLRRSGVGSWVYEEARRRGLGQEISTE